jgi:hypothetical protein
MGRETLSLNLFPSSAAAATKKLSGESDLILFPRKEEDIFSLFPEKTSRTCSTFSFLPPFIRSICLSPYYTKEQGGCFSFFLFIYLIEPFFCVIFLLGVSAFLFDVIE